MKKIFHQLKKHVERPWFGPFLGLLAALDYFVIIIPTDGLLITSAMTAPKHWIRLSFWLTLGSVAGAMTFIVFVQHYGNPFLEWVFPNIHENHFWKLSDQWMNQYGIWAVFFTGALPIVIHPVIAFAALAAIPLPKIAFTLFAARTLKYSTYSWIASHVPHYLLRLKNLKKEVTQAEREYMGD